MIDCAFFPLDHFALLAEQRSGWLPCEEYSISLRGRESGRWNSDARENRKCRCCCVLGLFFFSSFHNVKCSINVSLSTNRHMMILSTTRPWIILRISRFCNPGSLYWTAIIPSLVGRRPWLWLLRTIWMRQHCTLMQVLLLSESRPCHKVDPLWLNA